MQDESDQQEKGYCLTENLYMYYLPIGNQQLMHLTNGTECSQFYFTDNKFFQHVSSKLLKDVVQLNFYEKYALLDLLGKGTYSKVLFVSLRYIWQKIKKVGKRWQLKQWQKKIKMDLALKILWMKKKRY